MHLLLEGFIDLYYTNVLHIQYRPNDLLLIIGKLEGKAPLWLKWQWDVKFQTKSKSKNK